jgi:outer membrane cobalamin receptor
VRRSSAARRNTSNGAISPPWTATALSLLLATSGVAQVRDTTQADTTRRVTLAPIVVTATRVPVRSDRIGFSLSMLSSADLRMQHPANAAEALRFLGGAFIDEANGPGGPTIVRLRGGEEVFTQILVDGVPVNQNGGFFDLQGLALSNLERVEVARGPQSALHGSSAVSGVVQFLSRAGEAGRPRVVLNGEGSAATANGGGWRSSAEVSGGSPAFRYSAGGGWTFNRGIYALPNDARTRDASVRLDANPSSRLALTGTLRFVGMDAKLPVRDPGATRVPLDPTAENGRDRLVSALTARFAASDRWQHQLRASLYREKFVYDDVRDDVPTEGLPFFVFDATFRLDSRLRRSAVEYAGDFRAGGAQQDDVVLSWGMRAERETLDDTTSGDFSGRVDLERGSTAAFGEVLARPARWLDLLAGVRLEKYEGLDASLTPRGSAVIRALPGVLSFRLAVGRAYKAPNLQDQYADNPFIVSNPDLEPETSTSVEAGIDVSSRGDLFAGSFTVFRQSFQDLIRSVAFDETRQQNRNLGESRARGIEWRLSVRPRGIWAAGVQGTWLKTRIVDATGLPADAFPEGEELPFRPHTVVGAHIDLTPVRNFEAQLRANHVGEQTVLSERFGGQRVRLDGYTLLGLTVNYRMSSSWTLYGRFDNLLDTEYETAFDRHGIPATGAIGVRWQN